ncbi:Zn-dependent M28 family amino/carboxypeptidase [Mycobacterium sp. URHB0021]
MRPVAWASLVVVVAMALTSCSSKETSTPPDLARELAGKVSVDGMYAHLRKLQEVADANGSTRADGTPGYDGSLDYVAQTLKDKGFDVQTPEFERLARTQGGKPRLTVAGRDHQVDQASLMVTTPPGGLTALTVRPQKSPGCVGADYGSVSVERAIAVVDDAGCSVVVKQKTAVSMGAVGVLVVSAPGSAGSPAGLFTPGYYQELTVPVGVIDTAADAALRRTNNPVRLVLDSRPVMVKSRNVVAQTKSGDIKNVVMVGAHLDSSARSPGINDDGSGVAAILEAAAALGSAPQITNAVRFAFWASEENGLGGAANYLRGLNADQREDIALYVNADMLGSPNAGYFTYDGDQSAQPNPEIPSRTVPDGSAGIERNLAGYLNLAGVRPADLPLAKNTDYTAFLLAGIPIGGITTGSSQRKTEVQARLWGGRAGVAFDPNYHTAGDTIDNIDRRALSLTGPAVAYAVGAYAQSTDGVNGVPPRDRRHRNTP